MSTTNPHHPPGHKKAPSQPAPTPAATPAPAYVPLKWSYPFATGDDKGASDAHSFFEALSNAEDGFYPLGANGIWHGGVHFDTATGQILKQEDGVRAIADGEVVAYRLDSKYPVLKYQDGKSCMYSTGFVLVRHKLVLPPAQSASSPSPVSSASGVQGAHPTRASAPGGAAPTSAPADETLTFFSLYMHLLDWRGYKAVIDAPPASDASAQANRPASSAIKCSPFWKGEKRYRVNADAADNQHEPSTFNFSFPDSLRVDSPDSAIVSPGVTPDRTHGSAGDLSAAPFNWLDAWTQASSSNASNPFRFDRPAPSAKPKQPLAKGAQVYSRAKGEPIGLLPQGVEVQLGAVTEKDKGWAPITKVLKGEPVGLVVGDPVDPRVPTGWIKIDQFDLLVDPQPLDSVVVLDTPYPVAAGAVLGYLGEYQRYREASKLPPSPQRALMHLEVFAGPDLPAFIKKSQARAKQLGEQKAFLEVASGAMLVDVAEATETVTRGLMLKSLAKDAGNAPWVKVQPTRITLPPQPPHASHTHHHKVKPTETPEGSPVWVERALAGKTTAAGIKAWSAFPLNVSNARGPAVGFDEVFSRGELDKLGDGAKAQDDKQVHWWKITAGTADGNSREGWVCDTGHQNVQWHSPWEWPGFEVVDNTSVSLLDSFKRHLYIYEMLFDGDKEAFEPSAVNVNGSALIKKLEKVVDRLGNNDGKVSAQELGRAQRTRWVAHAMSHLVVRYESEWGGDLSKWESLSSLMKERKYIWQAELERIEKLRWWDKVHGVAGLPADPAVYHFHPVGLVGNFVKRCDCIKYEVMYATRGPAYRDDQIIDKSHYKTPIDHSPGRLAGNSRRHGDASPDVQRAVIDILVDAARSNGLDKNDLAMVLAIARVESGYNPDAAAGTTSASGLGQFVDATARTYGITTDAQRFDAKDGAVALVKHYLENKKLSQRRYFGREMYVMIYAFHHDGPSLAYGGRGISEAEVMPKFDLYLNNICDDLLE